MSRPRPRPITRVGTGDEPQHEAGALARIADGAARRDAAVPPARCDDAIAELRGAGLLAVNAVAGAARPPAAGELSLVRRVAAADGSAGRILDGHLNAVERIAVHAPAAVRARELAGVRAGTRLLGVWGGTPVPGEGPPAALHARSGPGSREGAGEVLRGVVTFCSGAGLLDAALVLARAPGAGAGVGAGAGSESGSGSGGGAAGAAPAPVLALVELATDAVEIDTTWYRSRGLVASMSHRVVFHDAPVVARIGAPGEIAAQPWFARDALRTAAAWAGMADCARRDALAALRERDRTGELEALAAGRMTTETRTIDVWLDAAARAMDAGDPDLAGIARHGRAAIAGACRRLLDEAARACGSHPFATARALDRARRDLEVFLLQHRLEPMLARAGAAELAAPGP